MEIIVLIYRANRTKKKVFIIAKMREVLLEVQVYIRLMSDLKYISERKYVAFMEETTVICWIRLSLLRFTTVYS